MANYHYDNIEFKKNNEGNKSWKPKVDKELLNKLHKKIP